MIQIRSLVLFRLRNHRFSKKSEAKFYTTPKIWYISNKFGL